MMIQNSRLIHNYHSRQVMLTKHNDNNKGTYVHAAVLGALLFFVQCSLSLRCSASFLTKMFMRHPRSLRYILTWRLNRGTRFGALPLNMRTKDRI